MNCLMIKNEKNIGTKQILKLYCTSCFLEPLHSLKYWPTDHSGNIRASWLTFAHSLIEVQSIDYITANGKKWPLYSGFQKIDFSRTIFVVCYQHGVVNIG